MNKQILKQLQENNRKILKIMEQVYEIFPKKMTNLVEYELASLLVKKEFGFDKTGLEGFMKLFRDDYNKWIGEIKEKQLPV